MTVRRLKQHEAITLNDKLREVCSRGDDNLAHYVEGWDDAKVAEALQLPKPVVEGFRRRMFGNLHRDNKVEETFFHNAQLEELLAEVREMKKWLKDVQELLEALR